MHSAVYLLGLAGAASSITVNFPFEAVQLQDDDIGNFTSTAFGDLSSVPTVYNGPPCKSEPHDEAWPTEREWLHLNESLGGRLLHPFPAESVCYPGLHYNESQCEFLLGPVNTTRFYLNNPLAVLTQWAEGDTCPATLDPAGKCTRGGYPFYVVNATTVKDIQLAINFARNKNIRLNIKNTGHDFVGRSIGRASLSVWTHHLKDLEVIPDYSIGEYHGTAVRIGAGVEAFECYNAMVENNITFVAPGDFSVGAAGGWLAGGGHSGLTSLYGLGSDQALSINVITANGTFLTADVNTNKDLFFALRGGGGSTYGIVTSAIFKTFPGSLNSGFSSYALSVGPVKPGDSSNGVFPTEPPVNVSDIEAFWDAYNLFLAFGEKVCDAGGLSFGYLSNLGNDSYLLTSSVVLPGRDEAQTSDFVQPLISSFQSIGINISNPATFAIPYASLGNGTGDVPFNTLFASRLFPRANWEDEALFNKTTAVIRKAVEAGLPFNGINYAPTVAVAGYPGNNAVNPAFRKTLMHATVYAPGPITAQSPEDFLSRHELLDTYMEKIRAVTPGAGAYINEADVLEPNWQQSFFGSNYPRLLEIKKAVDPWGLFWAPTTVGSEPWHVVTRDGLPTQNGPLCRTGLH